MLMFSLEFAELSAILIFQLNKLFLKADLRVLVNILITC
jgi:hypothetical protein